MSGEGVARPQGLVGRILAAYPDFRASMRRELDAGREEPQILAYAMAGSVAMLLAALPRIFVTPPAEVMAAGEGGVFSYFIANVVAFLFFVPLFLYGVAALARLALRPFGGTGGWRETRLATFWAILLAAPVVLASALIAPALTLSGAPSGAVGMGYVANLVAAWIWAACLAEAHGFRRAIWIFAVELALALGLMALLAP